MSKHIATLVAAAETDYAARVAAERAIPGNVIVRGSDHDAGAKPIAVVRAAGERAEWCADRMRASGYRRVEFL